MANKVKFLFKHYTLFIVLFAVLFYGLGRAFHMGWLNAFGVNDSFFPIDLQQSMFFGFISASYFAKALFILIGFTLFLYIIFVVLNRLGAKNFFLWINKKTQFDIPFLKFLKSREPWTEDFVKTTKNLEFIAYFSGVVLVVLIFLVAVCGYADYSGRTYGKGQRKDWDAIFLCQDASCKKSKIYKSYKSNIFELNIKGKSVQYTGFVIEGNPYYIALYTKERGSIIIPAGDLVIEQVG